MGRPVHLQVGSLSSNDGDLCLSVCHGNGQACRCLGLCLVPKASGGAHQRGRVAVTTTGTVGSGHVVRLADNRTNVIGRASGICLLS